MCKRAKTCAGQQLTAPGQETVPPAHGPAQQSSLSETGAEHLLPPSSPLLFQEGLGERWWWIFFNSAVGPAACQTLKKQGWVPVAGVQRGDAEGMQSAASRWESSGALPWVREERPPASWCHCISTGICSRRANHFTTPVNNFFFFKPIKKMPFFFPLYLSCKFLRRSRGAQHQSVTLHCSGPDLSAPSGKPRDLQMAFWVLPFLGWHRSNRSQPLTWCQIFSRERLTRLLWEVFLH